jgi:hypothetical protein
MFRYFDKTFFKFAAGFVAIVCISLVVFALTGYYEIQTSQNNEACCVVTDPNALKL